MICFSAINLANGDSSKHGSGIFVGKITATSGGGEKRAISLRWTDIIEESGHTGENEHHEGENR